MRFAVLIVLFISAILAGCDSGLKASDYLGGFYTQTGNCTETGKVGINHNQKQVDIGFYCFLKKCASISGQSSQGGYFHAKDTNGHYIQGRIAGDEAKGTWYLNINGENCSGHWAALKN